MTVIDAHTPISRRTSLKAGAALLGAGLVGAVTQPAVAATPAISLLKARRADDLVNIVGVRTTLYAATSSLYGNVDLVKAALRADTQGLGIRHIREEIILPKRNQAMAATQRRVWPQLAAQGIDFTSLIGDPDNSDGTVKEFATYIKQSLGGNSGLVTTVENSNEPNAPDKPWNRGNPNAWKTLVRSRQAQMAQAFRSDGSLNRIRLAGPSISGGAGIAKYRDFGSLAPNIDLGNFHYYTGNRAQSKPSVELDDILAGIAITAPGKPVYCTETGMHSAKYGPMASHPEDIAGTYMPRVVLEHFLRGIQRVYIFELLDDHYNPGLTDQEAHFGLLRYNRSRLDPKPAYRSLKRLLDLLRDPGAPFTPKGLAMRVTNLPQGYRQLLFEKKDGRRYLCMWRDVSIWNQLTQKRIEVPAVEVQVQLKDPADVRVYRPHIRTSPMATYRQVRTVGVQLSGAVKVLEISR